MTNEVSFYKNIQLLLEKYATRKYILIFFISALFFLLLMIFYSVPLVRSHANGMTILDMKFGGYPPNYAYSLFKKLGPNGRNAYLFVQIPLDMIYPLMFGIAFSLILTNIFRRAFKSKNVIQNFNIILFFVSLFDYMENICIITMLISYPSFSPALAFTTSVFTTVKFAFITITLLFSILGLIKMIWNRLTKAKEEN